MKSESSAYWFSPAPSEISSSRLSLDFGLRAADLFFRELVVPGLGRIWFVRQLCWPLAALEVHESLRRDGFNPPKPAAICHGIESLACKLEYHANRRERSDRILGTRAFGRDKENEVWAFDLLRRPANYVQNTHRQAATRALRVDGGLGLTTGSRFDLLELEPVGRALAETFLVQKVGKGGTSLRKWLVGWIRGNKNIPQHAGTLTEALSPETPTADECKLVISRVLEVSTPECLIRQRLSTAIGRGRDLDTDNVVRRLRAAGFSKQADEVVAARAFGAVLDRARDATAALAKAVEPTRGGALVTTLECDSAVRKTFDALRTAATRFVKKAAVAGINEHTSWAFACNILKAQDRGAAIRFLVSRVDQILALADESVVRGALFRIVEGSESVADLEDGAATIEPDRTGRTFRIANLHSLLRDARAQSAR